MSLDEENLSNGVLMPLPGIEVEGEAAAFETHGLTEEEGAALASEALERRALCSRTSVTGH